MHMGKMPSDLSESDWRIFFIKKKMIHKIDGCNYYMNIAMTGLKWEEFTTL